MGKSMPNRFKPAWRKGPKPLPPARKAGPGPRKGPPRGRKG